MEPDPYQKQLLAAQAAKNEYMKKFTQKEVVYDAPTNVFPLAELRKGCPEGVNPAKK